MCRGVRYRHRARAGGTPVVATTASFFQRAYDQFFQE